MLANETNKLIGELRKGSLDERFHALSKLEEIVELRFEDHLIEELIFAARDFDFDDPLFPYLLMLFRSKKEVDYTEVIKSIWNSGRETARLNLAVAVGAIIDSSELCYELFFDAKNTVRIRHLMVASLYSSKRKDVDFQVLVNNIGDYCDEDRQARLIEFKSRFKS